MLTSVYNLVGDTRYIQMIESENGIKNGDTRDITAWTINGQIYYLNNKSREFNGRMCHWKLTITESNQNIKHMVTLLVDQELPFLQM